MNENNHEYYIELIFNWFVSFLQPEDWGQRRQKIIKDILNKPSREDLTDETTSLSLFSDMPGSYLFYIECLINDDIQYLYDLHQGARIAPIFISLGKDLHRLIKIKNVESVAYNFLNPGNKNPDTDLFELLTAAFYARNKFSNIEFIPEGDTKRPDIFATKYGKDFYIECKSMAKHSSLTQKENDAWLKLWSPLKEHLLSLRKNIFIELTFHYSLASLPEDFLVKTLAPKLRLMPCYYKPTTIQDDEFVTVKINEIDLTKIKKHLQDNDVKNSSPQIIELTTEEYIPYKHYTSLECIVPSTTPTYIHDIDLFILSAWTCDDEIIIDRKARDIKRKLSEAVKQFPDHAECIVHFLIETVEGIPVTKRRFNKIVNTLGGFSPGTKNISNVFCHFFESFVLPDKMWQQDQSTIGFSFSDSEIYFNDNMLFNLALDEQRTEPYWDQV